MMINVREKDQMKQQRAYMGAVLNLGERKEIIPLVQPGLAMEYTLSKAIKKLAVVDKPSVGFLQGSGEPPLSQLKQVNEELGILYSVEGVTITDSTGIPANMRTLAIIAPTDSISPLVFAELDRFMDRGGNLFVAINRVNGDLQYGYGSGMTTGLETWLKKQGLSVNDRRLHCDRARDEDYIRTREDPGSRSSNHSLY